MPPNLREPADDQGSMRYERLVSPLPSSPSDTLERLRSAYRLATLRLDGAWTAHLKSRNHSCGGVAERLKAAVLKTAGPQGLAGSNPASSAIRCAPRATRITETAETACDQTAKDGEVVRVLE